MERRLPKVCDDSWRGLWMPRHHDIHLLCWRREVPGNTRDRACPNHCGTGVSGVGGIIWCTITHKMTLQNPKPSDDAALRNLSLDYRKISSARSFAGLRS